MRKDALLRVVTGVSAALVTLVAVPFALAAYSPSSSSSYSAAFSPPPSFSSSPSASAAVYAENRVQPAALQVKGRGHYSHVSVQDLKWSSWGQASASAHGTLTFQFCFHESCAVSPFYAEPVSVSLSRIQRCRARLSYTLLALDVEGPLPEESFKMYRTSLAGCQAPGSRGSRAAGGRPKRHG